jgi:4-amino-4-deoxy-L-arabinose transferase-like glycosyltransferase
MPQAHGNHRGAGGQTWRLLSFLAVGGVLLFLCLHLSWRSFLHGDEGLHGTLGRNIAADASHLLLGSTDPEPWAAPPARPLLTNTTPFYPALLAPFAGESRDPRPLRIPTFLAWLLVAISVAGIVTLLAGELAGLCAGAAFLLAPGNVEGFGLAVPDPVLTGLAWTGLLAAMVGSARGSVPLLFAAGALWGFAFLVKLWLVGEVILAWVFLLAARRLAGERRGLARGLAWPALAFALVGSVHLLGVWIFFPEFLGQILEDTYIGFSAAKFTGWRSSAEYWLHPWYLYVGILVRDHWPALLLSLPGLVALLRRPPGLRVGALTALLAAFGVSLLVLSVAAAKHVLYLLPSTPTLYVLAGAGGAFLLSGTPFAPKRRESALVLGGATVLAGGVALVWLAGFRREEIPLPAALAILASAAVLAAAFLAAGRGDLQRGRLATAAVAGILILGAADEVRRGLERPSYPYARVAQLVRGTVERAGGQVVFIGPDVNIFEYYLDRKGEYGEAIPPERWRKVRQDFLAGATPVIIESRPVAQVFPGTLYNGSLPEGERRWLHEHAGRILDGPELAPFRVYLSPSAARAVSNRGKVRI